MSLSAAKQYLAFPHLEPGLRADLEPLVKAAEGGDAKAIAELEDRFFEPLAFGTGGLRGFMAAGLRRMNQPNVRRTTMALATVAQRHAPGKQVAVVGYDTRINSEVFAAESAAVLAAAGYQVFLGSRPLPTPFLCFAMKALGSACGVIITASHNPKEYNGFKAYNDLGGQVVDPWDAEIEAHMATLPVVPVPPVAPGWSTPPGAGGPPAAPPYVPGQQLPGVAGWGAVPQAPKPGVIPLRPLGVGEILDGAISYMRRDPRTVLGISAIIAAAIALLQLLMFGSFATLFDRLLSDPAITSPGSGAEPNTGALAGGIAGIGGVALLVTVVTFLLNVLATGMLTTAMGRAVLGRPVSTSDVWQRARKRFWPLLGLTLLVGLAVGAVATVGIGIAVLLGYAVGQASAGLGVLLGVLLALAAVLATVWLTVGLLLAPVALILENVGVTTSMRRSFRLVKGAWWRTFGIYLLATILAYIVAQVLTLPFSFIGGIISGTQATSGELANPFTFATALAGSLGTLVSQTIVIPFTAGITALLYIDRRIRREALDIELARAAGVPGA